ncbi:MAG TPA: aminotransferase class III-fold pyridoxal phosphate-dependent enzyme, partial [Kofleriaceae bacterium]|nr:aminotransferase class III-fold pyridoxal phosphate-dependent enzyme [Kofleriaceae bacterium]
GEHNGTFRGNNHAFVTAAAALERYWSDDALTDSVDDKAGLVRERLAAIARPHAAEVRGRGLIAGIAFEDTEIASLASRAAFEQGLIVETAGPSDEVLKVLPALTIPRLELERGLDIMSRAVGTAFDRASKAKSNGSTAMAPAVRS